MHMDAYNVPKSNPNLNPNPNPNRKCSKLVPNGVDT